MVLHNQIFLTANHRMVNQQSVIEIIEDLPG